MSDTPERYPLIVMGREIGTIDGWDGSDHLINVYYNFEPATGVDLPSATDISIDYTTGIVQQDEEDAVLWQKDLLPLIASLPIANT